MTYAVVGELRGMLDWFFAYFEDPTDNTPWEGGYIWIYGGPYSARDILRERFASERLIALAAEAIESTGAIEWTGSSRAADNEDEGVYACAPDDGGGL